ENNSGVEEIIKYNNEHCHSPEPEYCILLFGTSENIRLLQLSPFWILDGTFRTCPTLFYQIYTVHGLIGVHDTMQKVVPLVFGLLSNKNERIYCLIFELLKSRASQFGVFPPNIWSVNSFIGTTVPITQNEVESWHHRWNTLLGRKKWNL
ncbi:hypothetical protein HW555_002387, partial [Spodoptera exigua]